MPRQWNVAWVTGASSGIGAEIALQLAAAGTRVGASSRNLPSTPAHPNIVHFPADVQDARAVERAVAEVEEKLGPIDLAVLAAGAYEPFDAASLDSRIFDRINAVNYLGVVRALGALLPKMMGRKSGQVAIVASVAGYTGLPKSAYYGPTKAALINLAESLWLEMRPHDVRVSVVNPGFVKTPMTARNKFRMPFLMDPPKAARLTLDGLRKGRFEVAYPWPFVMLLKSLQFLPRNLKLLLLSRLTG
jgi:NAD(P)-dependent dehydrogenase (short-subunit alcohol dehydrogenase family)